MAIYHLSIKIGKRHGSKSSVAAAAYRAGVRLKDERSGKIYDYTHKKEVTYSEIILPVVRETTEADLSAGMDHHAGLFAVGLL